MRNFAASLFAKLALAGFFAAAGTAALAQPEPPPAPQTQLPKATLQLAKAQLQVQIASSERERAIGLMSRTSLGADEGMLFVFPALGVQCFWMRNTLLPLSAAFIADDGRILNLADMQPLSDDAHCSAQPVRYVLEVKQGWFAQHGIQAGTKVSGKFFAKSKKPAAQHQHKPQ